MIKKLVFWFYAIAGPAIVIFFTFTANLVSWKLNLVYTCIILIPSISIPIALIILIENRLKLLKSKFIKVLIPAIIYIFGIACASFFIDFSGLNVLKFPILVLIFAIIIIGATFLELFIYNKLVIGYIVSPKPDIENSHSVNKKSFNLRSFSIQGFKILITALLIVNLPFIWFASILQFNSEIKFKYDKYSYLQRPTSEHLASLASDLLYSNLLEDRLVYFDLILKDSGALKIVYSDLESGAIKPPAIFLPISEDDVYDLFLLQYLNTYLLLGRYDDFRTNFISRFSEFKDSSYKYTYSIEFIRGLNGDDPKIPVIIETMNELYQEIDGTDGKSVFERASNIRVQQWGYSQMGNSEKYQELEKSIQELIEQMKKINEKQ